MCKVSVVIPVYNVEKYLRRCLDSLVAQTLAEVEFICVDDGSTDGSGCILAEYATKDCRFKVIRKENGGAASARNRGIAEARGKYLAFVDPDDWCEPEMLLALYDTAERNSAQVTVCGFKTFDAGRGEISGTKLLAPGLVSRRQPFSAEAIADVVFVRFEHAPWNKLILRDYLTGLGVLFQNLSRAEDLSFVDTCIACADRIAIANGAYYVYRTNRKGSSQNTNDSSPLAFCEGYLELKRQLDMRGRWETFATGFRRAVLASVIYTLKSLRNGDALSAAYTEFRGKWLPQFGLDKLRREDIYNPDRYYPVLRMLVEEENPVKFVLNEMHVESDSRKASSVVSSVPKVTVVVPVHNPGMLLAKCLDSVLAQTLREIEIVCVDDGSEDGSAAVLREYAARDMRLSVITQANRGVSAARNEGMSMARGEYVAFLDADDEFASTALWDMYGRAVSGNCDVVQCAHSEVTDGEVTNTYAPHPKCTTPDLRSTPELVRFQTKYVWDKLYRRSMLERNGIRFAQYGYHEDHLFLFRVDLVARNFASVPTVGYMYSKSSSGAATRAYDDRLLDCPKAYQDICDLARRAGLFPVLAKHIWANCSISYSWRVLAFKKYDDKELQRKIVDGWFAFFNRNFPRWRKNLVLAGYPVPLLPHKNLKVLLLGGTGALGSHLRDILAEAGHDVYVTSRGEHEDTQRVTYLKGDAMNIAFFRKLTQSRWDVIVDFMVYGPKAFEARRDRFLEQCEQYVFISSSRVYADAGEKSITEASPRLLDKVDDAEYLKTSEYALAKARSEDMLKSSERTNWTVIRPYITFSEQRLQLGTLEKEHWLKRVLDGKPIVFSEDVASKLTTLTYGRDVAQGMAAILGRREALGETFHITSPEQIRWSEVLELYVKVLKDVLGRDVPVVMTKSSCQLKTSGRYQVTYDRLFNRRFDSSKIGRFIDLKTFRKPREALEACLREFLKAPRFLDVNENLEDCHDRACGLVKPARTKYTVERNVQILIAALKAHGVNDVIASPGTTNLTFVASIQNDAFFRIKSAPDERSAAYMACGLAAESGRPVVICCTGATASRNYLPGLTEAYYRKLPVLAVTGTLDECRSGHLTAQFIDRCSAPVDTYVLKVTMPTVKAKIDEWSNTVTANRAILELTRHGGGPVQLNLETEHSLDYSVETLPAIRVIKRHFPDGELPKIPEGRVALFIGAHVPMSDELISAIDRFCEKYDVPVFCEHTGNYRGCNEVNFTLACYQQSGSFARYRPDTLIHIGEVSGDYPSMKMCGMAKVWRVNPDGEIRDTFRRIFHVFEMEELAFFRYYADERAASRGNSYREACAEHAKKLLRSAPELPFSNIWVASRCCGLVPAGSYVHFGVLNSFRSWSLFQLPKGVMASCNTGGFGIDGCLSTLLGASFAHPDRLHFAVLGDLAFFYDLNALGNRHVGPNLRILLVNNGKGVEFRNFNHPAAQLGDAADEFVAAGGHYGNKSVRLVRHFAEDLGFEYLTASTKEDFLRQAEKFWNAGQHDRPMLMEVFTEGSDDSDALELMTLIEGPSAPVQPKPVSRQEKSPEKPRLSAAAVKAVPDRPLNRSPRRPSRKIAILTFHAAFNCGAHLQAWALQTVLRRLGYEPEFPDCSSIGYFGRFESHWSKKRAPKDSGTVATWFFDLCRELGSLGVEDLKRHRFRMFAKHCLTIRPMTKAAVERRYNAVIVGSDQVWNNCITRGDTSFFRTTIFTDMSLRRYSYAISVGDVRPKAESLPYIRAAAKLFENLSFRENLMPELVDRHGRHPVEDPDPTLLLKKDDFNRIAYPKRLVAKPYLFVYSLTYKKETWDAARAMGRKLGLEVVFALSYQYGRFGLVDGRGVHLAVSPDRFIAYFRDAEAVVTSTFHGTAFSIIYGKRFAVLPNFANAVPPRCRRLLQLLHAEDHAVDDATDLAAVELALESMPRPETYCTLDRLAKTTIGRLRRELPDVSAVPRTKARKRPALYAWPFVKAVGGVKCLRDNGVVYTVKHTWGKLCRFVGVRSPL